MSSVTPNLQRLLDQAIQQQSQLQGPQKSLAEQALKGTTTQLAEALEELSPQQRQAISTEEKARLGQLAGLSFLDESHRSRICQVIGADPTDLGRFASSEHSKGIDSGRGGRVGAMGMQASLMAELEQRTGPARQLSKAEQTQLADNPAYQSILEGFRQAAGGQLVDAGLEHNRVAVQQLQDHLKTPNLSADDRKATQEQISLHQRELKQVEQQRFPLGMEAAAIADHPLLPQIVAYGVGLPHTLSKQQISYLDGLQGAGINPMVAAAGGAATAQGQLITALGAGDETRADKLIHDAVYGTKGAATKHAVAPGSGPGGLDIDAKLAALSKSNPEAAKLLGDYRSAKARDELSADRAYTEIMSLVHSGMPIEMIIMLVMLLLTQRQEERFKFKLEEVGLAEKLQRVNEDVQRQVSQGTLSPQEGEAMLVNPADFGFPTKSTNILMQELQMESQNYSQMMQALSAIMRQLQDLMLTPVRNIR